VPDPRVTAYAELLVDRCLGVQPGWQVVVRGSPLSRPLFEAVVAQIARRGGRPVPRVSWGQEQAPLPLTWMLEASEDALRGPLPSIIAYEGEQDDARIVIFAPENTRDGSELAPERQALVRQLSEPYYRRSRALETRWNVCQFPTPALAQDAGMSLRQFEDFLYGACLLDWDAVGHEMARIKERFDRANEVRLVGPETDLRLSLAGRKGQIDDGYVNMPGGEVFYSPVETATEGVVTYSEFPAVYVGNEVEGARLRFEGGRVVEASATVGEEYLLKTLDTDPGARVLGEFGIGCNPGITRHMKNTLFDEKIYGTVHLAVGNAYQFVGGSNESAVHWDMVKDLRTNGRIECDGEVVQENGAWLI
jgi:aminopeptidase